MSQDAVNVNRELFESATDSRPDSRVQQRQPQAYHKGYRVVGVPPRDVDGARRQHLAAQATAQNPKAWDEYQWLMKARRKPVNARPYELRAGAEQCAQLAINAHWQRVEIVELKSSRQAQNPRSAKGRRG
jgi:hypothetical protein